MAFDIGEILEKLKAIEGFASNVAETKKLADQLAENFAKMKMSINQTINDSFSEIATQIDTLRKNMEQMETVQSGTATPTPPKAKPAQAPTQPAESEPVPEPAPKPVPEPKPQPVEEPKPAPAVEPEPAPAVEPKPEAAAPKPSVPEPPKESDDQLDFLLQQKDRLKAALTDLRFDYMRGYIPEEEYKTKESELDSQLEDLDKQIAALK